jgi:hypothetical protein
MKNRFTGQLYQLTSRGRQVPGAYVAVNGPHDTFGTVLKSDQKDDGSYLNLIRGCKLRPGERTVASF